MLVVGVALLAAACSGSSGTSEPREPEEPSGVGDDPAPADGVAPESTAADGRADGTAAPDEVPQALGRPLGFDREVFEVPVPASVDDAVSPFRNTLDLVQAGVDAGIWDEVDGIRATLSVVMGELSPDAIPALVELPRFHYSEVVERAVELVDDPTVDDERRAELARLTAFFTAEELTLVEVPVDSVAGAAIETRGDEESATGRSRGAVVVPVAFAPSGPHPALQTSCVRPQEVTVYAAAATGSAVCYTEYQRGDDIILVADLPSSLDISERVFDLIDRAREGYRAISGYELQPVSMLVSPNLSPATGKYAEGEVLAHVASAGSSTCRVAMFASDTLATGTPHLDLTIVHELWHCIQGLWDGRFSGNYFVEEGGADYFAYEVLGQLCTGPQIALGHALDSNTVAGSLLKTDYDGWFFWAYLAEHAGLDPSSISNAHEEIKGGAGTQEVLQARLDDLPSRLNEFYVRLVGPGLACGFRGQQVTSTIVVSQPGPLELGVTDAWVGTRYNLSYEAGKRYEQQGDDGGPLGMANDSKRSSEDGWVVVEEVVLTDCTKKENLYVVPSPPQMGASPVPRKLEVTAAKPGGCDPCVIGTWSLDIGSFERMMESIGGGQDLSIDGTYELTFEPGPPDGSLVYRDARTLAITFPQTGGDFGYSITGGGTATYQNDGQQMSTSGYADSGQVAGIGIPVSQPFENTGDGGAPYTCELDEMTIQVNDQVLTAARVPATPKGTPYFS